MDLQTGSQIKTWSFIQNKYETTQPDTNDTYKKSRWRRMGFLCHTYHCDEYGRDRVGSFKVKLLV